MRVSKLYCCQRASSAASVPEVAKLVHACSSGYATAGSAKPNRAEEPDTRSHTTSYCCAPSPPMPCINGCNPPAREFSTWGPLRLRLIAGIRTKVGYNRARWTFSHASVGAVRFSRDTLPLSDMQNQARDDRLPYLLISNIVRAANATRHTHRGVVRFVCFLELLYVICEESRRCLLTNTDIVKYSVKWHWCMRRIHGRQSHGR